MKACFMTEEIECRLCITSSLVELTKIIKRGNRKGKEYKEFLLVVLTVSKETSREIQDMERKRGKVKRMDTN